jgi:hypothetical protein
MANLNSWQKITRVLPGMTFGDGADGDYNSSTIPTMTYQSCSGSSGSTTLTLGSSGFSNGDLLLIHQTRGTGAGQWEINKISSGGGTTSLTLQTALQYTYTDSGASQAQAVKIPRYNNVTVPSGATWTTSGWDGNIGGIFVLAAKETVTVSGTITANGVGFKGGPVATAGTIGVQGESYTGIGTNSNNANASGGGGGHDYVGNGYDGYGGGGAGHKNTGVTGEVGYPANFSAGMGGGTVGIPDLTICFFGSGGGSGGNENNSTSGWIYGGKGGNGGGIIFIFSKTFNISGTVSLNGTNGYNGTGSSDGNCGGGGGGSGGSALIVCQIATLGSNFLTALGGAGGDGPGAAGSGGAGSVGRIHLSYYSSYTGTTNPTLDVSQDTTLISPVFTGMI